MSELQRIFPPEVHESLAELRAIAKAAKSKDDPNLRKCTPDELALAQQLRKPSDCTGTSGRTGSPCTQNKLAGLEVCRIHGGSSKHVQKALRRRLAEAAPKRLENIIALGDDLTAPAVAYKANADFLDRFGVGALVQAKVRASKKQDQGGAQVVVNIGFLG